jgi:hypothetical protein
LIKKIVCEKIKINNKNFLRNKNVNLCKIYKNFQYGRDPYYKQISRARRMGFK